MASRMRWSSALRLTTARTPRSKPPAWYLQHMPSWVPTVNVARPPTRQENQLLHAAARGNLAGAACLLEDGVDVNAGADGTALHRAASEGHENVAHLLLEWGARVDARDAWGETPLHCAAGNFWRKGRQERLVCTLLDHGADVNARSFQAWTPLHRCALTGDRGVASLLLEQGADARTRTREGWTPLHIATRDGRVALAALLREHGAA